MDPETQDAQPRAEQISQELLVRLWPNRVHDSNWLKALMCRFGLHRWHELTLGGSDLWLKARFCSCCSQVKSKQELKLIALELAQRPLLLPAFPSGI